MTKELKKRARDFFQKHNWNVTGQMLYDAFNDIEVDELRQNGLLEHVVFDEWHWKGD
jgi:hypothetical protein